MHRFIWKLLAALFNATEESFEVVVEVTLSDTGNTVPNSKFGEKRDYVPSVEHFAIVVNELSWHSFVADVLNQS